MYRVEQKNVAKLGVKCCVPADWQAVADFRREYSNRGPSWHKPVYCNDVAAVPYFFNFILRKCPK